MSQTNSERFLIYMPLIVLPLVLGGARPWLWSATAGIFSLWLAMLLLLSQYSLSRSDINKSFFLLLPILLYPFLQVALLPLPIIAFFTPQRAVWLQRAREATGAQYTVAGLSYFPVDTFFAGLWYIVLALFAVCLQKLISKGTSNKNGLFTVLFAVAGAEAVYGILQIFIPSIATPSGNASGTFINRNHFASFLGMIWPLQLARLLTLSGGSRKKSNRDEDELFRPQNTLEKQIFFAFLTALTLLALLFSRSRGGILSALVGSSLLVFLGKGRFRRMFPFLAGCWITAFAYGWLIGLQGIWDRFASAGEGAVGRFQIYQFAWNMIKDHWLAGTGLATFGHVVCVYQVFDTDLMQVGNAHSDYLQIAVECGLPFGIFLAVLIWGYWLITAYELIRVRGKERQTPESANASLIRTGALAGSAAFLCHIWVESSWQIPANQVCFVILLVLMRFRPPVNAAERMKPEGILS